MKKVTLSLLVFGVFFGLLGCESTANEGEKSSSNSFEESTATSYDQEDKKMEIMKTNLNESGVEISYYNESLAFVREKGIDYDYFQLIFDFDSKEGIYKITLQLKGNIDGKKKDLLYYNVANDRIVESSVRNTDINAIAKVLESLNYSDQEILDFANWYYEKNM